MNPVLAIDFGSTYTKVTAVDLDEACLLGTAAAFTTVETDIGEGLKHALDHLEQKTGKLKFAAQYACSSAAGGLRMLAGGLVPELTAEAARQAALGAGAKVLKVYSYQLVEEDLEEINRLSPDIFLLTGGTDGGNRECILHNAQMLANTNVPFPVIIAGNRSCAAACKEILGERATVCENVMPVFNQLAILPAQIKIRGLFLQRIIRAKGLSKMSELISGIMMPTPAAMLDAMTLLADGCDGEAGIGPLLAMDLGGATTDVYSVADGMPRQANTILKGLPEPYAKRTVEGDIGMRYSVRGIEEAAGIEKIARLAQLEIPRVAELLRVLDEHPDTLPDTKEMERLDFALACCAVETAALRHAGTMEQVYTPMGTAFMQTGKNLTGVRTIVATGGAIIHTKRAEQIALCALADPAKPISLRPTKAQVLVDRNYILAAMGLLGKYHPQAALRIMKKELQRHGAYQ